MTRCVECDVPLTDALPSREHAGEVADESPSRPITNQEPVVVFASGRSDLIVIAKSILISADVDFSAYGESLQDVFGWGRFPSGSNLIAGPVEILVAAEDAADAKALLADLTQPASAAPASDNRATAAESAPMSGSGWDVVWIAGRIVVFLVLCYWAVMLVAKGLDLF